jgi:hypothetical protein
MGYGGNWIEWAKRQFKDAEPVYDRPQAREQQPCPYVVSTREGTHHCSLSQREPLTDEQLPAMWAEAVRKAALPPNKSALIHYKEAIEAAHQIFEEKK